MRNATPPVSVLRSFSWRSLWRVAPVISLSGCRPPTALLIHSRRVAFLVTLLSPSQEHSGSVYTGLKVHFLCSLWNKVWAEKACRRSGYSVNWTAASTLLEIYNLLHSVFIYFFFLNASVRPEEECQGSVVQDWGTARWTHLDNSWYFAPSLYFFHPQFCCLRLEQYCWPSWLIVAYMTGHWSVTSLPLRYARLQPKHTISTKKNKPKTEWELLCLIGSEQGLRARMKCSILFIYLLNLELSLNMQDDKRCILFFRQLIKVVVPL